MSSTLSSIALKQVVESLKHLRCGQIIGNIMDRNNNRCRSLTRINKERDVLNIIKRRKLEYFGHIMRNQKYELLHIITRGKIESQSGPGRRKTSSLRNPRQRYGLSTATLFRTAVDKVISSIPSSHRKVLLNHC